MLPFCAVRPYDGFGSVCHRPTPFCYVWLCEQQDVGDTEGGLIFLLMKHKESGFATLFFFYPRFSDSLRMNSVISLPTRVTSAANSLVVTRETPEMTAETWSR